MLEVRGISKTYRHKQILQDVSFSLAPGFRLGIAGHNGSGKSTLLSIIARVTPPDEGDVLFDGVSLLHSRTPADLLPGFVPQEDGLPEDLAVKDVLAF